MCSVYKMKNQHWSHDFTSCHLLNLSSNTIQSDPSWLMFYLYDDTGYTLFNGKGKMMKKIEDDLGKTKYSGSGFSFYLWSIRLKKNDITSIGFSLNHAYTWSHLLWYALRTAWILVTWFCQLPNTWDFRWNHMSFLNFPSTVHAYTCWRTESYFYVHVRQKLRFDKLDLARKLSMVSSDCVLDCVLNRTMFSNQQFKFNEL